jgi:flagellar hook-associated protein 1 FlgK
MSLVTDISMLSQAMRNFQQGLDVTSNNIANALTPGYSRETLNLEPLPSVTYGDVTLGNGAIATSTDRIRNTFLDTQIKSQLSQQGFATALQGGLQALSAVFPEIATPSSTAGIQGALNNLTASWTALEASPTSTAAQTAVLGAMQALTGLLNTDVKQVYTVQANLDAGVNTDITKINSLTAQIATLNTEISQALGQGQQPNELMDQREQAAESLAGLIGSTDIIGANGAMNILIPAGALVSGGQAFQLKAIPSATAPGRTGVGYYNNPTNTVTNITSQISSGDLGGLIQARDVDAQGAIVSLNQIAYGLIQNSNEINSTFTATDTTTNHILYTGTGATDIAVASAIVNNVSYIGGTRDAAAPGDLAKIQASLQNFMADSVIQSSPFQNVQNVGNINPGLPMSSQPFFVTPNALANSVTNPGKLVLISGANSVTVSWGVDQSLNQVIENINANSGGAFYATWDNTQQKIFIYSNAPMTVYDQTFNLGKALKLSSVVSSSMAVNNSPVTSFNQIDETQALNAPINTLNLATNAAPLQVVQYQLQVDKAVINWGPTQSLDTIMNNITVATAALNDRVDDFFNPVTQTVVFVKSGDPASNPLLLTPARPMTSIGIEDITGNFTDVANADTVLTPQNFFTNLSAELSAKGSTAATAVTEAKSLVTQTQTLQNSVSQVNTDQENAQALVYERAYEAAVRLQTIMDDVLNVLINNVGSPSSSNNSTEVSG